MKIAMIGVGYVGLVTGTCLSNLGNSVICMDIDASKIQRLSKGELPFYEPGLRDLVEINSREGRLKFTTDMKLAVQSSDVLFIAVNTPSSDSGEANLAYVFAAAKSIAQNMNSYKVVVVKSTVPVGTCALIEQMIGQHQVTKMAFDVVSNPEFLREGEAIHDFMLPDRVIIGAQTESAKKILLDIYKPIERTGRPILITDIRTSELIKYVSNAMLATRISFMNEISRLCEKVGADVKVVARGIGLDDRIGPRFLQAGAGYGGSCFPKDVKALISMLNQQGCRADVLAAVDKVNENQKSYVAKKVKLLLGSLAGKKIAVWGLAFKPKTDDMREAASIVLINDLQKEGAQVVAFDPVAKENAMKLIPGLVCASNPYEAVKGADCLVVITEWDEFRELDRDLVKSAMREPNIVDARNIYEPFQMKQFGFNYVGMGR